MLRSLGIVYKLTVWRIVDLSKKKTYQLSCWLQVVSYVQIYLTKEALAEGLNRDYFPLMNLLICVFMEQFIVIFYMNVGVLLYVQFTVHTIIHIIRAG